MDSFRDSASRVRRCWYLAWHTTQIRINAATHGLRRPQWLDFCPSPRPHWNASMRRRSRNPHVDLNDAHLTPCGYTQHQNAVHVHDAHFSGSELGRMTVNEHSVRDSW
jgi:hypothetical protein